MRIPHSSLLSGVLGFGVGIGLTLGAQQLLAYLEASTSATQTTRPNPSLASPLLLEGEPSIGSPTATLTIVEFSDFECSYCKQFHDQVMPQLTSDYINTGKVRFVHKDLPLPFHRQAIPSAAAARCAGEQKQYWEMYGTLFDQQSCLNCKGVLGIAKEQQLDMTSLQECMQKKSTIALINANQSEADLHNIRATPTFVIGATRSDGKFEGTIIEGALPWPQFKDKIDQELRKLESS